MQSARVSLFSEVSPTQFVLPRVGAKAKTELAPPPSPVPGKERQAFQFRQTTRCDVRTPCPLNEFDLRLSPCPYARRARLLVVSWNTASTRDTPTATPSVVNPGLDGIELAQCGQNKQPPKRFRQISGSNPFWWTGLLNFWVCTTDPAWWPESGRLVTTRVLPSLRRLCLR